MRGQFCPICKKPATDDSRFCAAHRAQAQLFSTTLVPTAAKTAGAGESAEAKASGGPKSDVRSLLPGLLDAYRQRTPVAGKAVEFAFYFLGGTLHSRTYFSCAERRDVTVEAVQIEKVWQQPDFGEQLQSAFDTHAQMLQAGGETALCVVVEWMSAQICLRDPKQPMKTLHSFKL